MIKNIWDSFIIIILFLIFGILHSFFASNNVKKYLSARIGNLIAYYRLFYVIISILLFYFFYQISPDEHITVFDLAYPFDILILIPQLLGLAGIFWTLKYFNVKEFLGLTQILRLQKNQYDINELDEHMTLRIEGPYRYCRHPVYFFSIIFLGFRSEMDLNYLTFFICISVYFYVGSFYEEKKLVERFGSDYQKYQQQVSRIVPLRFALYKKK